MKKYTFAAGAAALVLGIAGAANAASSPCTPFNHYEHPAKASQIKAALVQAFVSCNNPGGRVSNSETETGTATCYPAETNAAFNAQANGDVPDGTWTWGPKSQGTLSFKAGKNKIGPDQNPLNQDPNAVDLYIQIKISDIHDENGLANGSGSVNSLARTTLIDRAEQKVMTVFDFPTAFPIQAINGKVSRKISATEIINPLNQPALPKCTTIELVSVVIRDPNTNNFAAIGTYMP
jgi:hypothetical protein